MYGWCDKCDAVALEGMCSEHGPTKPMSHINAIDAHPLSDFEKRFLNERSNGLKLGKGVFMVYGDRTYRKRVVTLDKPLLEIKLLKDGMHVEPLVEGKIEGMDKDALCSTNRDRIEKLTKVTKYFAQHELKSNGKNALISFSGGRDSTVLAHLLKEFDLKKVFIDTRLEFSETYKYVEKLQKKGEDIDIARSKTNFFKLCKEKGFPDFKNRWCCKTQKAEPFDTYIKENFGKDRVSVFTGVRRWESIARIDQPIKKPHKHIANQDTIQVLLNWLSLDTWIYSWENKVTLSDLYKYFDRGGCWTCPFGLKYRLFLLEYSHPKYYRTLEKIRAITKFNGVSIAPCNEGKSMTHLEFPDERVGNAVARLLGKKGGNGFEVHDDGKIICVPEEMSRQKIHLLIKKAESLVSAEA